jgi:4-amino-4-deoxy-L-arabinose transferase
MRRPPWWLVALLVLLAFAFQGARGLWEPDEGRYATAGLNMPEDADWILPSLDGVHPHLTKPPVTYWALAASFGLFGVNEWAARLPGALAFVGTGLLVFGLGRRLCPESPALPALVHSLGLAAVIGANIVSTDNLLVFFETAAMYAFVEAWHRGPGLERRWIRAMWLLWGLAFMTKGPPGLLPLAAVVVLLAWRERGSLRQLFDPVGVLGFAVVAFTWFGVVVAQDPSRLGYFLGYEVYDRIFTDRHDRNADWYDGFRVYLPVLVVGSLPWWPLALASVGGPRRAWSLLRSRLAARDRDWCLLVAWFALPFAVFMLARSRLELYVLPLFVPLSLALARPLARWAWLDGRRLAWVAGTTAVALVVLKGTLAHWPNDRDSRAIAGDLRPLLESNGIGRVTFVGMKPFYGLNLYLDARVDSIELAETGFEYATYVPPDAACAAFAARPGSAYVVRESRSRLFHDTVSGCSGLSVRRVGEVHADDHRLGVYVVRPDGSLPGA